MTMNGKQSVRMRRSGMQGAGRTLTAAAALTLGAGTAMADVTPADVWADWQDYMTGFGFAVDATETPGADGLELSDIVLTQTLPEDAGDTTITIGQVTLKDNGDGTVRIVYPEELPIKVEGKGPEESYALDLIYTTKALVSTVSGDAARLSYDYTADAIGLAASSLTVDGAPVDLGEARLDMRDIEGRTVMTVEDARTADQVVTSGQATYSFAMADPEEGDVKVSGQVDTLELMGKVTIPEGADSAVMSEALAAGFALDSGYVFGPGSSAFEMTSEGATTSGTTTSQGGKLSVRMDETGLAYGLESNAAALEVTVPQMLFALSMAMDKAAFDLAVPVAKDDSPQDFALNLLLGGLTLGDNVWALFDPQSVLPRDPASVALDLNGKATLLADLTDPSRMMGDDEAGKTPVEVNEVTLSRLLVSLAGAELTGKGAVTIDNEDKVTYDGRPKPVGSASFVLTGSNALLDKLVAMGMLEKDQAMMARMTLGMAAVKGDGEDVLKSDIEFTEEGGIIANGMQLK